MTPAPEILKPNTSPVQTYPIGLEGDSTAKCIVDRLVYDTLDYAAVVIEDDYALLPDGSKLLNRVFSAYGLDRYIEQSESGYCKLALIDGNPLNCTVENITVQPL